MRILSIDPGYDRVGIAIMEKNKGEKEKILFSECLSPQKKLRKEEKMLEIGKKVKIIIQKWRPEVVVLETLFFNKNQKTAMSVAEVRGILIYEAMLKKIKIYEFTPSQIKVAVTGSGSSDKRQIESMVKKITGLEDKKERLDDEYDAIALGLTFFAYENWLKFSTDR